MCLGVAQVLVHLGCVEVELCAASDVVELEIELRGILAMVAAVAGEDCAAGRSHARWREATAVLRTNRRDLQSRCPRGDRQGGTLDGLPDGLIKAIGIVVAMIVIPGMVFGFPSAVLTVGGIVFTTGVVFGLGRAG